jgi:hypothetical protein
MDALIPVLSAILVPLFFIGMIGSLLVVLLTIIRDLQEIFTSDDASE